MSERARLLVVDDESSIVDFLSLLFEEEGYAVETASSVTEARKALTGRSFDLILCDVMMPDGSGLDILKEAKSGENNGPAVVMMTAYTSTKTAIEAMKSGAADYISKPFDVEELKIVVLKALEREQLAEENIYLRRELEQKYTFNNIIGKSPRMQAIFSLVERIARTSSTVLIHGESGTGKELIARAIHFASPRTNRRFLSLNCGAMPENLLESELFGHERGAFTGAVREKKGLFQEADRGTLFLDEIGEMTPTMQVKLLRAIQERVVRKVGGTEEETVDVRIIAATNQDLETRLTTGEFREDLYYRINVLPIHLPPLRQRREDVPLLVDFFLQKYCRQMELPPRQISVEAMHVLESYDWPGNVRELENLIERILALSHAEIITTRDLPVHLLTQRRANSDLIHLPEEGLDLEAYLEDIRAQLMQQALERTSGVQTQAAELLGMSFRSFRYYAKKAGLKGGD
ncbi:MAG: two-component system, NtrC family, response regulator PilR [Acidobacteriota bacterium]|jgi:DNA-binding NtrC family response regulator|nr:two-component system, NtrC family, response regulator PilR [Acidobacteriota bacterium]